MDRKQAMISRFMSKMQKFILRKILRISGYLFENLFQFTKNLYFFIKQF